MQEKCFLFDTELLLAFLLGTADEVVLNIFSFLKKQNLPLYIATVQLPSLETRLKERLGEKGKDRFWRWLKKTHLVKTPSYIDLDDPLAKWDIERYLIKLSAESIGGKVVTQDKDFLDLAKPVAISPKELLQCNLQDVLSFCNLKRQYFLIYKKIERHLDTVFKHNRFINGPEIEELEKRCAEFVGVKHAIGVSSGTDALLLALMAYGVGPGDYVITTPFTFVATAEAIVLLGATPLFVDIDKVAYNIDPEKVKEFLECPLDPITGKEIPLEAIKGLIAVDLYGQPADFDAIKEVLPPHFFIIEDAAQAFGAEYKGRRAGGLADIGITSFFPAKPLGAYGDGGMVFTNDDVLAEKIRWLKDHGQDVRYNHRLIGLNARLDTLQAAVLLAKFDLFVKEERKRRNKVACWYHTALKELEELGKIKRPTPKPEENSPIFSVWAQYSILAQERNNLSQFLAKRHIPTAIHYPKPLHLQPAFSFLGYKKGSFPVAERVAQRIISLPLDAWKKKEEVFMVAEAIKEFYRCS
jgi:UDP-2-acetamido-2-deoxy-ribo-hexuluronate aminotransferase